MRWSNLFIPTLRETPADAEAISHALLIRGGYIRQLSAGIYNYLYLAQRSVQKIINIVREEMNAIGGQEMFLAALNPAEIWQESGRWDLMGDNLFRLKDRFGRPLCLAMTHEEIMTFIARGELRSYKQLPQIWYQFQTKFRDEARPKSGLLRVRQFIMKDSYSFDIDENGLDVSYQKHRRAYCRIFERCGLEYVVVEADSGAMGGSQSEEFMVASPAGEDHVVICKQTGYAANLEKATSNPMPPLAPDEAEDLDPEEVHTPDRRSIEEVSAFFGVPTTSLIKSLVMVANEEPVLVLLRGDHQLSTTKLSSALRCIDPRLATAEEVQTWFGCEIGSVGPVAITTCRIVTDTALEDRRNMICGANRTNYHIKHVTPGEDFDAEYFDVRQVGARDTETTTGAELEIKKTIEIGHIFKLGYKYSQAMNLNVLNESGKQIHPIMGSYGIGIERILSASVELYSDDLGMSLPVSIAPFEVVLTPINITDDKLREAADRLYIELAKAELDVLYDDRQDSPGIRLKDADLIGIPYRIILGKKLATGLVELYTRRTRTSEDIPLQEVVSAIRKRVTKAKEEARQTLSS